MMRIYLKCPQPGREDMMISCKVVYLILLRISSGTPLKERKQENEGHRLKRIKKLSDEVEVKRIPKPSQRTTEKATQPMEKISERKKSLRPKRKKKIIEVKDDHDFKGPLSGVTVVFTGVLEATGNRDEVENLVKSLGGRCTKQVSRKTTFVVAGHKLEDGRPTRESVKYKKAESLHTQIMTEHQFDAYLQEKTGNTLSNLLLGIPASIEDQASVIEILSDSKEESESQPERPLHDDSGELWTTRFAPKSLDEIVGNSKEIEKFIEWLEAWHDIHILGNKREVKLPFGMKWENFGQMNINAKGCMITGPPGIGKTTSVRLVAKQLDFVLIETNASDVRTKDAVNYQMSLQKNNVVIETDPEKSTLNRKCLLLMDEVDGMTSDRGGVAALTAAIKAVSYTHLTLPTIYSV
eukprot:TRINITY_DN10056_c0_g1_i2.p1 TRINITY_DN10056_c0_g1~~TRINITY_DN10056_c0_g1_i2.p1  ORF type:complete len:409 (-),score=69.71 TRINITY_DN10056_c0_g1_i2:34-1260(-)